MGKIDKELILEAIARSIDVVNAMDDPPDFHLFCGGGETVAECTWFIEMAYAGSETGERLRASIARRQATDPHFEHVETDVASIRESGTRRPPPF